MAAKQRYVEGEEQDVRELERATAAVKKKQEGVPFPSSIYGRSKAEKYLTCDHKSELNRAAKIDADSIELGANHKRTRGRLSASEAVTCLARVELEADEAKKTWYQSDRASDAPKENKKQQGGGQGIHPRIILAEGGEILLENMPDLENQVSSPFKALSKIKNQWQKMKSRNKAQTQLTPISLEAQRIPDDVETISNIVVERTQDLHISSPKTRKANCIRPSSGSGLEDLSEYIIPPRIRRAPLKAPMNEVHPFAVPEDVPINHTPIIRTTIINDELDRRCAERLRRLRQNEESRRANSSAPKVQMKDPNSPPTRKECWGALDDTEDLKANPLNEERSRMDLALSKEDDLIKKANLWNNFF